MMTQVTIPMWVPFLLLTLPILSVVAFVRSLEKTLATHSIGTIIRIFLIITELALVLFWLLLPGFRFQSTLSTQKMNMIYAIAGGMITLNAIAIYRMFRLLQPKTPVLWPLRAWGIYLIASSVLGIYCHLAPSQELALPPAAYGWIALPLFVVIGVLAYTKSRAGVVGLAVLLGCMSWYAIVLLFFETEPNPYARAGFFLLPLLGLSVFHGIKNWSLLGIIKMRSNQRVQPTAKQRGG